MKQHQKILVPKLYKLHKATEFAIIEDNKNILLAKKSIYKVEKLRRKDKRKMP